MHRLNFYVLAILLISSTHSFAQSKKNNVKSLLYHFESVFLSISFKLGFQRFIFISVILLLGNFSLLSQSKIEIKIDSLKNLIGKEKDVEAKTKLYLRISQLYSSIDFENVKEYAILAEKLAYKHKLMGMYSHVHLLHGNALLYLGKYQDAILQFHKCVDFADICYKPGFKGYGYNGLGLSYMRLGEYTKSTKYFYDALRIAEETNNEAEQINIYLNLGSININIDKLDKAEEALVKVLEKSEKAGNKSALSMALSNLATVYIYQEKYNIAIEKLKRAIEINLEMGNDYILAINYQNLLQANREINNFPEALKFGELALALNIKNGNKENEAVVYNHLGLLYLKQKDFRTAEKNFLKYIEIVDFLGDLYKLKDAKAGLYNLYKEEGKFDKALSAYEQYISIKDSLYTLEDAEKIAEEKIKFEYDKKALLLKYQKQLTDEQLANQLLLTTQQDQALTLKEQALTLSNQEKDLTQLAFQKEQAEKQEKEKDLALKNIELTAQQKQNLYLGAFIFFLLCGLGALIYFYQTMRKQKNIISQQNQLNEQTISILSHDIKEPMMSVQFLLNKLNTDDPYIQRAKESINDQVTSVNSIVSNLLQLKKNQNSLEEKVSNAIIYETANKIILELNYKLVAKSLSFTNNTLDTAEIILPISSQKLYITLLNLITNAIKHSPINANIELYTKPNGIYVRDFGPGIDPNIMDKIGHQHIDKKDTSGGSGMGLLLVNSMLANSKLKLKFENLEDGGTLAGIVMNEN